MFLLLSMFNFNRTQNEIKFQVKKLKFIIKNNQIKTLVILGVG